MLSNPERRELYDRFGHAGLRSRGYAPTELRLRDARATCSPRSSATTSSVSAGAPRGAARGADVAAEVAIELVEAAARRHAGRSAPRRGRRARPAAAAAPSRARSPSPARRAAAAAAALQQVSQHRLRPVRPRRRRVRAATAPAAIVEHPVRRRASGAGRVVEERTLDVEIPPGIHDGQRIRIGGEGHAGALGGRAGDLYVLVRVRPDPRFVREGQRPVRDRRPDDDATRRSARRVTVPTLDGRRRARSSSPARNPARCACCADRACRCSRARGRGDLPPARQRRGAATAHRRAAGPARAVRARRPDDDTYGPTRASSTS